jgi:hypothetical protein
MRRVSSLQSITTSVNRNIGSMYDNVKTVAENIDAVILASLNAELSSKYLGTFTENPVLQSDGSVLTQDNFYFNTSVENLGTYYYDSTQSTWVAVSGSSAGAYDDTAILAAIALNTSKVSNVNHPSVEKAVPSNAVFTDTVYDDTFLANAVSINNAKVSNVNHPLVEKAVPSNAVFTDTTYSVEDNGLTEKNFTLALSNKLADIAANANNYVLPFSNNSAAWNTANSWGDHSLAGYETSAYNDSAVYTAIGTKQDTLVSGTNVKTIKSVSILGAGNIDLGGASAWGSVTGTLSNQTDLQTALDNKATSSQGTKADSALQNITGESIKSLSDVFSTMSPADGQILTFDTANGWQAQNAPSGGVVSWGDLSGTLASQTDLQTALNSKVNDGQVLTNVPAEAVFVDTTYVSSNFTHDGLTGVNADQHIDWTLTNAKNIHASNYTNTVYTLDKAKVEAVLTGEIDSHTHAAAPGYDDTTIQAAVDLNTAKETNIVHPLVETAVPTGAVFTDTTYAVGDGGLTEFDFTAAYKDKLVAATPTLVVTDFPGAPVAGTLYIKVTS